SLKYTVSVLSPTIAISIGIPGPRNGAATIAVAVAWASGNSNRLGVNRPTPLPTKILRFGLPVDGRSTIARSVGLPPSVGPAHRPAVINSGNAPARTAGLPGGGKKPPAPLLKRIDRRRRP